MKKSIIGLLCLGWTLLSATDPNTVVTTIDVGSKPSGIAITPNNLFAYVANNGDNTVSVLNLTTNTVETVIADASFNQPYTITINASGTTAYVTNSNGSTITIIHIPTNTVTGTINGFDGPSGMVIAPNGIFAYVNNYGGPIAGSGNGTTVRVVNLQTNLIVGAPITVGQAPAALAITPNGAYVYVVNYVTGTLGGGTVSIIKTSNNTVIPPTITGLSGPYAISITPNGRYAYVTNFGSNKFTMTYNTSRKINIFYTTKTL